ncbi:Homeodomain-interacting protein kinase 1 [Dissostichus eleginoides]|uniref:Homeodomain-interacting protein kinase 1 n=1 Tax=Dissostichus eleginoides TaxID=100907 RepID=A0AAD9EYI4_DISEL|nr:Homeodomain-interacting protein kinase 1 [Dissostichus eleginoides]
MPKTTCGQLNAPKGTDLQKLPSASRSQGLSMCGESAASWPSSLYLADNLFPVDYEYQMMKFMVEVLGQPKDHMLRAGIYTKYFFIEEVATHHSTWRLMGNHPEEEVAEVEDRMAFVDFLKQLLHLDGDQRISPHYALQQSFITKSHLTEPFDSRDRVYNSAVCKPEQKSAAGIHVRSLLSARNDNTATFSCDGSKATVSFDDEEDP